MPRLNSLRGARCTACGSRWTICTVGAAWYRVCGLVARLRALQIWGTLQARHLGRHDSGLQYNEQERLSCVDRKLPAACMCGTFASAYCMCYSTDCPGADVSFLGTHPKA